MQTNASVFNLKAYDDLRIVSVPLNITEKLNAQGIPKKDCRFLCKWKEVTLENMYSLRNYKSNSYALVTGIDSNLLVIDWDLGKDKSTQVFYNYLIDKHGIPDTYIVQTANKGVHWYFFFPESIPSRTNIKCTKNKRAYSIDIRADGGVIIAAGSSFLSVDGTKKEYIALNSISDMKEAPDWLFQELEIMQEDVPQEIIEDSEHESITFNGDSTSLSVIEKLLACFAQERCDDYTSWRDVCFALKSCVSLDNEAGLRSIFINWSKRSAKFDLHSCEKLWSSIAKRDKKALTKKSLYYWARKDNSQQYSAIFSTKPRTLSEFSPDITINQRHIDDKSFHSWMLGSQRCIALKSNMNTGKSFALASIFDKFQKIICVYFRVSLASEKHKKWIDHGFKLYSDLPQGKIDTDKYPRVIIQLDSLHRVMGNCDLLILDEIESSLSHMLNKKTNETSYDGSSTRGMYGALREYISHSPKTYMCDATLCDATVNAFFQHNHSGEVLKIENTFKSFEKTTVKLSHNKTEVIEHAMQLMRIGKKVVIACNWQSDVEVIEARIMSEIPNYKVLRIDSTQPFTGDVNEWSKYDGLIYSPSILAGVSFEKVHFDQLVAIFDRNSCFMDMCLQMLARIRNLRDNCMTIFTPLDSKNVKFPSEEEFDTWIEELVRGKMEKGIQHIDLDYSAFHKSCIKNTFYNIYKQNFRKQKITQLFSASYLQALMESHGMQVSKFVFKLQATTEQDLSDEKQVELKITASRKINKELRKEKKEANIEAIYVAPTIDKQGMVDLLEKQKSHTLTNVEKNSIEKYKLASTFNLVEKHITMDFIKTNLPLVTPYKNFCMFKKFRSFNTAIDEAKRMHKEYYDERRNLDQNAYEAMYDNSESDAFYYGVVNCLTYDTRYLRMQYCLQMLQKAGFKSLNSKDEIKLNWNALLDFCKEEARQLEAIFNCEKKILWGDVMSSKEKVRLYKFLESKVQSTFGLKIERTRSDKKVNELHYLTPSFL